MSDGVASGGALGPGALAFASAGLLGDAGGGPEGGLTPFDAWIGSRQGRLAVGGDPAFVLGTRSPGRLAFDLAAGDGATVAQAVEILPGDKIFRVDLRLLSPALPEGFAWRALLLLDGAEVASARAWAGRERAPTDLAVNVARLSGSHTIGVRLELEET